MGKVMSGNFGGRTKKTDRGIYYKNTKKLLENYENLKCQIHSFEEVLAQRYKKTFVNINIEEMSAEEVAELMTTKSELTRSEVKLLECRRSYLKSKYMLQLIDSALEELKTRENGLLQYELIKAFLFEGVHMDDIEEYMSDRGRPMSATTAYRTLVQGISTLSILLWGYKAIADEITDELISPEIQNLFEMVA